MWPSSLSCSAVSALTAADGEYRVTPLPIGLYQVEYTLQGAFRCPHIHFAISKSGHRLIATQMLIKGDPGNERDGIVKSNRAKGEMLESVMVDFKPVAGSKLKEYTANWDIVIGRTAQDVA